MKKIFTITLAVALGASAYAESINVLSLGMGVPGVDEPQLYGLGLSPDGKYVCGAIEMGNGIFVANAETGVVKWSLCGEEGGELRHITNDGKAIGISNVGITYSFDDPKESVIQWPDWEGVKYFLGESLTNDGKTYVGSMVAERFITHAAFRAPNGEFKYLPIPSEEELGSLKKVVGLGSSAKLISADGDVIFGCLGSFALPIIWTRNADGEYEYDFFVSRFINSDDTPVNIYSISGMYFSMSNNGRYVLLLGMTDGVEKDYLSIPLVYDTKTKEMKYYTGQQPIDIRGEGLYPGAIADDGTFVGTIGMPYYGSFGSYIMKAGRTIAESYNAAFPEYNKKFGVGDDLGFNMVTGISADGRYILGYTFYSDDYYDQVSPAYYVTYIIDRGDLSGVETVSADNADASVEAVYDINGVRKNEMTKGLNIIRMSDGSVRKVMK